MNRIDDDLLYNVNGGASREHTLCLGIELPSVDADVKVTAYLNRELYYSEMIRTSFNPYITLRFKASCGRYAVDVYTDDVLYRQYELDFDNSEIRQL